ncbi:MAG: tetratricopeptide repeat protein, partial [Gemmatimonadetes bacterium]|nr:tetratricopeptide repeat protein [Gemmatimonadota bacterium]
ALLEAERYGEAEAVFELALEYHPHNGWSLFGLEEALRAQGRDAEADQVHEAFEAAWARSDTWIRGPVF